VHVYVFCVCMCVYVCVCVWLLTCFPRYGVCGVCSSSETNSESECQWSNCDCERQERQYNTHIQSSDWNRHNKCDRRQICARSYVARKTKKFIQNSYHYCTHIQYGMIWTNTCVILFVALAVCCCCLSLFRMYVCVCVCVCGAKQKFMLGVLLLYCVFVCIHTSDQRCYTGIQL